MLIFRLLLGFKDIFFFILFCSQVLPEACFHVGLVSLHKDKALSLKKQKKKKKVESSCNPSGNQFNKCLLLHLK